MSAYVNVELSESFGFITFSDGKSNALNSELISKVITVFREIELYEKINVVILKSEGKVFCAGASFDEILNIKNQKEANSFFLGFQKLISCMIKSRLIIIGMIHGKTIGGGVGIAAACDYIIANQDAQFKLSEINLGIGPFVIEPIINHKIGKAKTIEMTFNPDIWYSANWSYQSGLVSQIEDDLLKKTIVKAKQLASLNKRALIELKKMFWKNKHKLEKEMIKRAEISGELILSDYVKNQLRKFKNNG